MADRITEPVYVWRTDGGFHVLLSGRTGKLCTLREGPYGVHVDSARLSAHSEVIYTRFGKRYRQIDPGDVRAGMVVHIETVRDGWVQTSLIQESYAGVRVKEITADDLFLVFDEHRASLVPGKDPSASIPLLAEGWTGAAGPLWEPENGDQRIIIRVEKFDNHVGDSARLNDNCPGWEPLIRTLHTQLEAAGGVKVTGVWSGSDGELTVRLDRLHSRDHDHVQAVRDIVREAGLAARRTCLQCGEQGSIRKLAGRRGEPFGYALCDPCALGKYMRDEVSFPIPDWTTLPEGTDLDAIMVEPGWWALLSELRSLAGVLAPVERMYAQQRGGRLRARIDLPHALDDEIKAQVHALIVEYEERAAALCEHCGDPGRLSNAPWTHTCCGECDGFEIEARMDGKRA